MSLIVYNSNRPEMFCEIDIDCFCLTEDQHRTIETACNLGPYLAFYRTYPECVYRIRGPFLGPEKYWIIDSAHLVFDDAQRAIAVGIEKKLSRRK